LILRHVFFFSPFASSHDQRDGEKSQWRRVLFLNSKCVPRLYEIPHRIPPTPPHIHYTCLELLVLLARLKLLKNFSACMRTVIFRPFLSPLPLFFCLTLLHYITRINLVQDELCEPELKNKPKVLFPTTFLSLFPFRVFPSPRGGILISPHSREEAEEDADLWNEGRKEGINELRKC